MKKGYIKIHLPAHPFIMEKLDMLMERGLLQALEKKGDRITVLDKWENRRELRKILHEAVKDVEPEEEFLEEKDWDKTWVEAFQPLKAANRIWITPPWFADRIPENEDKIIINPGNAFGTGTHESTRLALSRIVKTIRPGFYVLDLGCGSGILSLAARKLGAAEVRSVDNDPEIENNFLENVEYNKLDNINLEITDVLGINDYNCDLAVINIQKNIILPLLKRFTVAKGVPKRVILAGLLREHEQELVTVLNGSDFNIIDITQMNEWIAITAVRRSINEDNF